MKIKAIKWIAVIVSILVLLSIYIYKVIDINKFFPKTIVETYKMNDTITVGKYAYTFKDIQFLSVDEASKKYDLTSFFESGSLTDIDKEEMPEKIIILVKMTFKNLSDEPVRWDGEIYLQCGLWDAVPSVALASIFKEENIISTLKLNEEKDIIIPFLASPSSCLPSEWNKVLEKRMTAVLTSYPVKKVVELY